MPIYEYRCPDCGRTYEQLRKMSDADRDLECPYCASPKPERQLSTFACGGNSGSASAGCSPRGGFS